MKAIVVTDQAAGTAGMTLVERPEPDAARLASLSGANYGDVVIEVHASGFTGNELEWPSTWIDRLGRDRTPSIPGHEVAGVVTALSYGLSVGQRVFGLTAQTRRHDVPGRAQVRAPTRACLARLEDSSAARTRGDRRGSGCARRSRHLALAAATLHVGRGEGSCRSETREPRRQRCRCWGRRSRDLQNDLPARLRREPFVQFVATSNCGNSRVFPRPATRHSTVVQTSNLRAEVRLLPGPSACWRSSEPA